MIIDFLLDIGSKNPSDMQLVEQDPDVDSLLAVYQNN